MRRRGSILAVATLMATLLPSPSVAAGASIPAYLATKPGTVVRTISFRTTRAWATPDCSAADEARAACYSTARAGRYVTVGAGIKMYRANSAAAIKARDASHPLDVSFGVFAAGRSFVRLLGPNGLWVRLVTVDGARVAVADGKSWAKAALLKITTLPREKLASAVRQELTSGPDPTPIDGLACITAYSPEARRLGVLAASKAQPRLRLSRGASCGASTSALFNTDLPQGATVTQPPTAAQRDPLLPVRFVPPDRPAWAFPDTKYGRLKLDVTVGAVRGYFHSFIADIQNAQGDLANQYEDIKDYMMWEDSTYEPPKLSATTKVTSVVMTAVSGLAGLAGPYGKAAGGLLSGLTAGITLLVEEANTEEPRLLQSVRNNVAESVTASMNRVQNDFRRLNISADLMRDRITAGCEGGYRRCVSQRALAVWANLKPVYPTQEDRMDAIYGFVAGLERQAWLDILPTRAVLYGDVGQGLGPREEACEVYLHPYRSPGVLYDWVAAQDLMRPSPVAPGGTSPVELKTSPYLFAVLDCIEWYFLEWSQKQWEYQDTEGLYRLGLRTTDGRTMPLPNGAVNRLFGAYDRDAPFEGGLGLSRREIGCLLDRYVPAARQKTAYTPPPLPGVSHHACDFHYTRAWWPADKPELARYVSPNFTSPHNISMSKWGDDADPATPAGDPLVTRLRYKPGLFAIWIPDDPARLAAHDWDLAPAREPRAIASACAAPGRLAPSPAGGGPTTVMILNVSGADALVYRTTATGGKGTLAATVPADPRLVANADTYHPLAIAARAGQSFYVTDPGGACLGVWTAPAGDYSLVEIHGAP
jgi:hypothetical protein